MGLFRRGARSRATDHVADDAEASDAIDAVLDAEVDGEPDTETEP